jgi:SAM-dependent methyltransferase
MSNNRMSYRESHAAAGYGQRYDENYATGYYAAIYREVEAPLIEGLFKDHGGVDRSLLDFACGTGRITRLAIPYFGNVVGVDVSKAMLDQAQPSIPTATFIQQDLTEQQLNELFDVVTSFRFFLNAEHELRVQALKAIHKHLRHDGMLICNIHMNRQSIMGGVYALMRIITGRIKHKTMSLSEFKKLLDQTNFEIEQVIWYGLTPRPGRMFNLLLDRIVAPLERTFRKIGVTGRFAHSFIVVARPIPSANKEG